MEKIKNFCEKLLEDAKKNKYNALNFEAQAYGAIMFYFEMKGYNEKIANWWNDEMHSKFREILIRKP